MGVSIVVDVAYVDGKVFDVKRDLFWEMGVAVS